MNLEELIQEAREYRKHTPLIKKERDSIVKSFAYGNLRMENPNITMSDIERAIEKLGVMEIEIPA